MDEPLPMTGQLPDNVRSLIDRKLRLLKRDFEKRNGIKRSRIIDEMGKAIRESFCAGNMGKAFIAVPLDTYRELTKEVVAAVIAWPALVVDAITATLTKAGVSVMKARELDELVDAHAWSISDRPPMLGYASPEQFTAIVHQLLARFGPVDLHFWNAFKNQFDLPAAAGLAVISNEGRSAREAAAVAIEELLVANRSDPLQCSSGPETAEARRVRLAARKAELIASGDKSFIKTIAAEENLSDSRVKKLLEPPKRSEGPWSGLVASSNPPGSPKKKAKS